MKRAMTLLIAAASLGMALYAAIVGYFYVRQDAIVFPASHDALEDPAKLGPGFERDKIVTEDGLKLDAWYHPAKENGPVILYFHGNAGTLNNRAHRFKTFVDMGYGVFAPEYRGYGQNPGRPSGRLLAEDGLSAWKSLIQKGVAPKQIVVMGESLGTYIATQVATHEAVAGLVLDAPFTSVADVGAQRLPALPVKALIRNQLDTSALISHLTVPLLVLYTTRDTTVPPSQSQKIYESAPEPKTLFVTQTGSHSTVLENGGFAALGSFMTTLQPSWNPAFQEEK